MEHHVIILMTFHVSYKNKIKKFIIIFYINL